MESSSVPTSLSLLACLRQDDRDAWSRFVRLYTPLLHSWAKRQGFNDSDADDLTQEVLLKLMRELPSFSRKDGHSFRGWLFRVTSNVCHDFRRRRATRRLPSVDGLSGAEEEPALVEFEEVEFRKSLVESGLALIKTEFEANTWAAFEQMMILNRPVAEIATSLGISKNAVYIGKSRVLTRLREVIDDFLA
jgi:RNA polymerase sigma-70 factor (ECF subfamily)